MYLWQVLAVVVAVAGLGARVDHVEDILLLSGVVAQLLEGFIPVGVFDDDVALGIDPLWRS